MRQAYLETIRDLEIALYNTGLFEFKEQKRLSKEILKYEKLLKEHDSK